MCNKRGVGEEKAVLPTKQLIHGSQTDSSIFLSLGFLSYKMVRIISQRYKGEA